MTGEIYHSFHHFNLTLAIKVVKVDIESPNICGNVGISYISGFEVSRNNIFQSRASVVRMTGYHLGMPKGEDIDTELFLNIQAHIGKLGKEDYQKVLLRNISNELPKTI